MPPNKRTRLEAMKQAFRPFEVPSLLAGLCTFWDKHATFFSGSFEVDYSQTAALQAWFKNNPEGYKHVRVFGIDGIHSLYGLWLFHEKNAEKAPVVYLGGEGEGTVLLAAHIKDFMRILASNREWEPFDKEFLDVEKSTVEANRAFRRWLKEGYQIVAAKDPAIIMRKASKANLSFQKWLAQVRPS